VRATTAASGGSAMKPFGNRHGSVSLAQVSSSGVGTRVDSL